MILPDHDDRRAALTDFQRNLVVTAGAGTGKTSLLVGRLVAALVLHHLDPQQVLAVTFTENAANEMRERLIRILQAARPWVTEENPAIEASDRYVLEQIGLGPENLSRVDELLERVESLAISTFHGFCLNFLRENARALDLPPDLTVGSTDGSHTAFDEVFLQYLQEASEGSPHEALLRFDATELRELAQECVEMPEDSLDRIAAVRPPGDLAARREDLQKLVTRYPKARANWQEAAAECLRGYQSILDGEPFEPGKFLGKKATPTAGKREVGDEADEATAALDAHQQFLLPFLDADQAGVALALDFVRPLLQRYRQHVVSRGEVGFQDLLLLTRDHLRRDPMLRATMARRLHAILVDEFQDTDPLQYDVVFLLAAESPKPEDRDPVDDPMELSLRPGSLFIVGDAKQSIYRFRRADVAAFTRAVQCIDAQGGRTLELTANFRSCAPILGFVNAVCDVSLAQDRPYQFGYAPVEAIRDGGAPPVLLEIGSEASLRSSARREREGNLVVGEIQHCQAEGIPYRDMAILLRAATDTSWVLRPLRAAGIPYVLEGSRRFFQRQEVILCRALLGAIARPHDEVAVLAVLRSSLATSNDGDIADFVAGGGSLDFRLGEAGSGPVATTLTFLRELHQELAVLPIDVALTRLLTLPRLRLVEGSGFEGAQRLANIERLLQKLLHQQPLDLADAASTLAADTDAETDDEESPLFDGGVDAVRVLTVHRAKGLEFPVVFVPDLARKSVYRDRQGLAQAQRLFDAEGREVVTIRIGDTRNVASLQYKNAGSHHDKAEQRRLFYVAATRAKDRLYLIRGESVDKAKRPWQDDLAPGLEWVEHRVAPGQAPQRSRDDRAVDPAATLAAHAAFLKLRDRLAAGPETDDVAPSRTGAPAPAALDRARSEALAIGTATHAYFAAVDLGRSSVDEDLLAQLPGSEAVREMAESYHRSDLRARLASARALHREVPLTFVEGGAIVHGVVDLVVEEADGSVTVLDWKTDRIESSQARRRAVDYRPQLTAYARGVALAMQLPAPPRTEVHFLRSDTTVEC